MGQPYLHDFRPLPCGLRGSALVVCFRPTSHGDYPVGTTLHRGPPRNPDCTVDHRRIEQHRAQFAEDIEPESKIEKHGSGYQDT